MRSLQLILGHEVEYRVYFKTPKNIRNEDKNVEMTTADQTDTKLADRTNRTKETIKIFNIGLSMFLKKLKSLICLRDFRKLEKTVKMK